jgi:hypothetical protein
VKEREKITLSSNYTTMHLKGSEANTELRRLDDMQDI